MTATQVKKETHPTIEPFHRSKRLIWNSKRRNSFIRPNKFIY